jgi:hypothetical protein
MPWKAIQMLQAARKTGLIERLVGLIRRSIERLRVIINDLKCALRDLTDMVLIGIFLVATMAAIKAILVGAVVALIALKILFFL